MTNDNVVKFSSGGEYPNFRACLMDVMKKYPEAKTGIVIVFDGEPEDMISFFRANEQQVAYASVRLAHFVNAIDLAGV